jgi:hypothetical protein
MMEEASKQIVVPDEPTGDAIDPNTVVNLQLRMPDGSKVQRRFFCDNKVEVRNYLKCNPI